MDVSDAEIAGLVIGILCISYIAYLTFAGVIAESAFRWYITLEDVYKAIEVKDKKFLLGEETTGFYNGYAIVVQFINYGTKTCVALNMHHKLVIPCNVSILKETVASKSKKIVGIDDIIIGDKMFDKNILVKCNDDQYVIPLLNKSARKTILRLSRKCYYLNIENKGIKIHVPLRKFRGIASFRSFLDSMIEISRDISGETRLKKRIIENILTDSSPQLKLKNIEILASRFKVDTDVRKILFRMLKSENIDIQIASARHLTGKGMKFLFGLLIKNNDMSEENTIKIIKILKENSYSKAAPVLRNKFNPSGSTEVKLEIIDYLIAADYKKLLPFLEGLLDSDESEIKVKAIEALGLHGSRNTVQKLYAHGKNTFNLEVKRAVRDSLKLIQSRLGIIDTGWLSIPEHNEKEGALSLSDTPLEGALSKEKKKRKKK